jgi:hypothetical protein
VTDRSFLAGPTQLAAHTAPPVRRLPTAAAVLGVAGVAVLFAGTFLPWVVSGQVTRNLYTVAGIAQRVGLLGPGSALTSWLPLIGPLCILPLLLALLRLRRTAAVAGIAAAAVTGGAAVTTLAVASGRSVAGVSLDITGPGTVVAGAALLLVGAICLLRAGRPATRRTTRPASAADRLPESGTGAAADPSH